MKDIRRLLKNTGEKLRRKGMQDILLFMKIPTARLAMTQMEKRRGLKVQEGFHHFLVLEPRRLKVKQEGKQKQRVIQGPGRDVVRPTGMLFMLQ